MKKNSSLGEISQEKRDEKYDERCRKCREQRKAIYRGCVDLSDSGAVVSGDCKKCAGICGLVCTSHLSADCRECGESVWVVSVFRL